MTAFEIVFLAVMSLIAVGSITYLLWGLTKKGGKNKP